MRRTKKAPPKIYWIRVAVEADAPYPSAVVGEKVDYIRRGIHVQGASYLTERRLLDLIGDAIHSEVAEEVDPSGKHDQTREHKTNIF